MLFSPQLLVTLLWPSSGINLPEDSEKWFFSPFFALASCVLLLQCYPSHSKHCCPPQSRKRLGGSHSHGYLSTISGFASQHLYIPSPQRGTTVLQSPQNLCDLLWTHSYSSMGFFYVGAPELFTVFEVGTQESKEKAENLLPHLREPAHTGHAEPFPIIWSDNAVAALLLLLTVRSNFSFASNANQFEPNFMQMPHTI